MTRAVVAVLASLFATLTTPSVPNGDLRLLVPAYFSLGGSGSCSNGKLQGDFAKLAEGGSRVTAILRWEDKDCVKPLRSKHVSLLGYVDVDYESWNANYVADQIRIWQNAFPSTNDLIGLYFGRLPPWEAGGGVIDSVLALITAVTKQGYYLVAEPGGLSGGLISPQYLNTFSSFVAFNQAGPNSEGHGAWYNGSAHGVCPTPSFVKSPAPKNYCKGKQICNPQGRDCRAPNSSGQMSALVFSQPQLSQSTIDAARRAGYQGGMFISDAGYTRLPSYWSDEPTKF